MKKITSRRPYIKTSENISGRNIYFVSDFVDTMLIARNSTFYNFGKLKF